MSSTTLEASSLAVNTGDKYLLYKASRRSQRKSQITESTWGIATSAAVRNGHIPQDRKHVYPQQTKGGDGLLNELRKESHRQGSMWTNVRGWLWTMWIFKRRGLQELGILTLKAQRWEPWFIQMSNLESP